MRALPFPMGEVPRKGAEGATSARRASSQEHTFLLARMILHGIIQSLPLRGEGGPKGRMRSLPRLPLIHRGRLFPFIRETLNKSSAAGQRIFCPHAALRKVGNTQSIPPLFEACLWTKSLAASSCRFNQSFPRQLFAAPDAGLSEFIQSDKKVLAISGIYWYNICNWYASQKPDVRKRPT